jgi:adenylate cyclase
MRQENRHLAAILFADIAGYSTLSHRDEKLAFQLVKEHRELVRPLLAEFEGREIKTMGDGFMAEFRNAQSAVLCAIAIQNAHLDRNRKTKDAIQLRIGIHMSDVIPSEGDVFGDGVNIAARLMQHCRPGRICVSASVMEQARQVIPHWVSTLGPTKFKGISNGVSAFVIYPEYSADMAPPLRNRAKRVFARNRAAFATAAALTFAVMIFRALPSRDPGALPPGPKRVAVLPLQGIGLSDEYSYLTDGITEELISGLSELRSLRVLSKSSSETIKGKSVAQIRRELGAAYVIEGSVQKFDERLRVRVRFVDTGSGENLWSKEFEESVANVFSLERKVAGQITGQFGSRSLASIASTEQREAPAPDSVAYQHYLKGISLLGTRTKDGIFQSLEQLEKSIELEPNYAPALAAAAHSYLLMNFYGYEDPQTANKKGEAYAKRALALDPHNSYALLFYAERSAYELRDWSAADSYYQEAIANNPSSSTAFQWYGKYLEYMGRFDEAKTAFGRGLELDPLSQRSLTAAGSLSYYQGEFDETIRRADDAIKVDSAGILPHLWKGKALLMKGDHDAAAKEFDFVADRSSDPNYLFGFRTMTLVRAGKKAEAEAQWKKIQAAATKGYIEHFVRAQIHYALGDSANCVKELELSAKARESQAVALKVDPYFRDLRGDPRFQTLLKELKLSL